MLQEFAVGTQVLLRNSRKESKKGDKLKPRWLGPYSIHESLDKGVFRISNIKTGVVLKNAVNQKRLKRYLEPKSTSGESDSETKPERKTNRDPECKTNPDDKTNPDSKIDGPLPKKKKVNKPLLCIMTQSVRLEEHFIVAIYSCIHGLNNVVLLLQLSRSWISDLDLDVSDKVIITVGGMLSDRHMYAAHKLLASQFPSLQGLQSTLLSQTSFQPVSECGGYTPEG